MRHLKSLSEVEPYWEALRYLRSTAAPGMSGQEGALRIRAPPLSFQSAETRSVRSGRSFSWPPKGTETLPESWFFGDYGRSPLFFWPISRGCFLGPGTGRS